MTRRRFAREALCAGLILCAQSCAPIAIDNRSVFAGLTYTNHPLPPRPNLSLQLFAALELEGITAYANPKPVARCYRALSAELLRDVGADLSHEDSSDPARTWGRVERELLARLPEPCAAVSDDDRQLLAYSIAHMAGAIAFFARSSVTSAEREAELSRAALTAIDRVALLLEQTPAAPPPYMLNQPVLALSGGSANGAFTAGFLFELLWARERALLEIADPARRLAMDRGSRFAGLVGTSVGALLSQVLDLYAVDPEVPLTAGQRQYLDACLAAGGPPATTITPSTDCYAGSPAATFPGLDGDQLATRPVQSCALALLHRSFTNSEEKDLMCVEAGAITRVVGVLGEPRLGLMRFDSMSRNIVDPLLAQFASPMLQNDTTRVVVSVEMQQNQTLGLDERSCSTLPDAPSGPGAFAVPGSRAACLGAGVLASVVLPFFARPLRHAYSGFSDGGECSTWIDGGLRSGFPVLRALRLSRPRALSPTSKGRLRVLALETGRANGLANRRPENIVDVTLNAIGQLADANTVDELVLAQLVSSQREREFDAMANAVTPRAVPTGSADDFSVSPVYVPSEVPPALVADAGYSFDRYVMRGLFTWGRRMAMRRLRGENPDGTVNPHRKLAVQLGWPDALQTAVERWVDRDVADPALQTWQRAYELNECPAFREARLKAGHDRLLSSSTPDCQDIRANSTATPSHFVCPTTALDLGAPPTGVRP